MRGVTTPESLNTVTSQRLRGLQRREPPDHVKLLCHAPPCPLSMSGSGREVQLARGLTLTGPSHRYLQDEDVLGWVGLRTGSISLLTVSFFFSVSQKMTSIRWWEEKSNLRLDSHYPDAATPLGRVASSLGRTRALTHQQPFGAGCQ